MFYYSIHSRQRVVHLEGCGFLKRIKSENLKSFDNICEVCKNGCRICAHCSPLLKKLKREEQNIIRFCQGKEIFFFIHNGEMRVVTPRSEWRVLVSGHGMRLELHHRNTYEGEHENSIPGFHKQKFKPGSIVSILKYIDWHEQYRYKNPIVRTLPPPPKKKPQKGTRRWNKERKKAERRQKKQQIRNVLTLIEALPAIK